MVMGMPNVGKSSLINAMRRNYLRKGSSLVHNPLILCFKLGTELAHTGTAGIEVAVLIMSIFTSVYTQVKVPQLVKFLE